MASSLAARIAGDSAELGAQLRVMAAPSWPWARAAGVRLDDRPAAGDRYGRPQRSARSRPAARPRARSPCSALAVLVRRACRLRPVGAYRRAATGGGGSGRSGMAPSAAPQLTVTCSLSSRPRSSGTPFEEHRQQRRRPGRIARQRTASRAAERRARPRSAVRLASTASMFHSCRVRWRRLGRRATGLHHRPGALSAGTSCGRSGCWRTSAAGAAADAGLQRCGRGAQVPPSRRDIGRTCPAGVGPRASPALSAAPPRCAVPNTTGARRAGRCRCRTTLSCRVLSVPRLRDFLDCGRRSATSMSASSSGVMSRSPRLMRPASAAARQRRVRSPVVSALGAPA